MICLWGSSSILLYLLAFHALHIVRGIKTRNLNCLLTRQLSERRNGALLLSPQEATNSILNSMKTFDVDDISFGAAMQVCHEAERPEAVLQIYDFMKSSAVAKRNRLCDSLAITSCNRLGHFHQALQIFNECDKSFRLGSSQKYQNHDAGIYDIIIGTLNKWGQSKEVLSHFRTMVQERLLPPSDKSVDAALQATITLGLWDEFESIKHSFIQLQVPHKQLTNTRPPDASQSISAPSSASAAAPLDVTSMPAVKPMTLPSARRRPSEMIYVTLIRAAGLRGDPVAAFRYLQDSLSPTPAPAPAQAQAQAALDGQHQQQQRSVPVRPSRAVFREVIEACELCGDWRLAASARGLMDSVFGSMRAEGARAHIVFAPTISAAPHDVDTNTEPSSAPPPSSSYLLPSPSSSSSSPTSSSEERSGEGSGGGSGDGLAQALALGFNNSIGCSHSLATRGLWERLRSANLFDFNIRALPQGGIAIPENASRELLLHHAEKKALAHLVHLLDARAPSPSSSYPSNQTDNRVTGNTNKSDSNIEGANEITTSPIREIRLDGANAGGCPGNVSASVGGATREPEREGTFRVDVNMCMCEDCHTFFKAVARLTKRTLQCRDPDWTHNFSPDGRCSCADAWNRRGGLMGVAKQPLLGRVNIGDTGSR